MWFRGPEFLWESSSSLVGAASFSCVVENSCHLAGAVPLAVMDYSKVNSDFFGRFSDWRKLVKVMYEVYYYTKV